MSRFTVLIKSPRIQIALAAGVSIITLAYVSKRVLPEPIGGVALAFPPLVLVMYELVAERHKGSRACTPGYWVVGVLIATLVVILFHAL